jgi:hypothetical protein
MLNRPRHSGAKVAEVAAHGEDPVELTVAVQRPLALGG